MINEEKIRFAPSIGKKKSKEAIPIRQLSIEKMKKFHSPTPKRLRFQDIVNTDFKRLVPKYHNSTSTYIGKQGVPFTTPDRNKSSTQNIYNIIFNNSNININNSDKGLLLINNVAKEPEVVKVLPGQRVDRKGEPIVKGKKRHGVSFLDRVEPYKRIHDVANVESYKQYNLENSYNEKHKSSCTSSCCLLI
jgi:hypothetical protein